VPAPSSLHNRWTSCGNVRRSRRRSSTACSHRTSTVTFSAGSTTPRRSARPSRQISGTPSARGSPTVSGSGSMKARSPSRESLVGKPALGLACGNATRMRRTGTPRSSSDSEMQPRNGCVRRWGSSTGRSGRGPRTTRMRRRACDTPTRTWPSSILRRRRRASRRSSWSTSTGGRGSGRDSGKRRWQWPPSTSRLWRASPATSFLRAPFRRSWPPTPMGLAGRRCGHAGARRHDCQA